MSFFRAGRTGVRFLHNLPSTRVGNGSKTSKCLEVASPLTLSGGIVLAPTTGRLPASTILSVIRSFADKPAGRPKQHTGKAPARKTGTTKPKAAAAKKTTTTTTTETTTAADTKPKRKLTPSKKKALQEQKARRAARVQKKREAAKVKTAAQRELKAKAVVRQRKRKEKETAKASLARLKEKSLVASEPRRQPSSPYIEFYAANVETHRARYPPGSNWTLDVFRNMSKSIAAEYRNLPAEDREAWNHRANAHSEAIREAYTKWVQQYTPMEISQANRARTQLRTRGIRGFKNAHHIKDPRSWRTHTPYMMFIKERWASGDMKHIKSTEVMALIAKEWKDAPQSEKERLKALADEFNAQHQSQS